MVAHILNGHDVIAVTAVLGLIIGINVDGFAAAGAGGNVVQFGIKTEGELKGIVFVNDLGLDGGDGLRTVGQREQALIAQLEGGLSAVGDDVGRSERGVWSSAARCGLPARNC